MVLRSDLRSRIALLVNRRRWPGSLARDRHIASVVVVISLRAALALIVVRIVSERTGIRGDAIIAAAIAGDIGVLA